MKTAGMFRIMFVAVGLLLAVLAVPSAGTTYYVDPSGSDGANGLTWATAFATVGKGITSSIGGDVVEVNEGTYNEAIDFLGKAVRLYSSGGPEVTTIDGTGHYHVVQCVSGEDANTILEGFTITGGNANGSDSNSWGGGMYNDNSSPTVTNCTFSGNTAADNGGGMSNNNSSNPTVTNCTFSGNTADGGGGMYNSDSSLTVSNCILWGNTPEEIYDDGTSSTSVSYSDVEGGYSGTGNIDADPCFVDADANNFRLLYDSPCIDAGDNNSVPPDTADLDNDGNTTEPIPFDLYGLPRLEDGDGDRSAVVDMGAYESKAPPYAHAPSPADGAELVTKDPTLTWKAGVYADEHEVYFGTDETAVADANTSNTTGILEFDVCDVNSYTPTGNPLVLGKTYYWKITEVNEGYVGPLTPPWEGDVWSFRVEGHAYDPYPGDGEANVPFLGVVLSWAAGAEAESHDVYFGTDEEAVAGATTSSAEYEANLPVGTENYPSPGELMVGKGYYWRIDEVNESGGTFLKGDVWSFTTVEFLIADDFESYADTFELLAVWDDYWVNDSDGIIDLENGADIIREPNSQAAKLEFTNMTPMGPGYIGSWFDVQDLTELDVGPDWTIGGVKALTLYMRGDPCNVNVLPGGPSAPELSAGRPWVELEDTWYWAGYVLYPDANDILEDIWHEWNIDLSIFDACGVTLSAIDRFTIGIGGYDKTGPSGEMSDYGYIWVDDIRLYVRRCVRDISRAGGDISGEDGEPDCFVDGLDLSIVAEQWLTSGPEGDIVDDGTVNFEDYGILGDNWLEELLWPPE
ncbi:MAG: right-handed parallel beta-helix repeat-containing protein [Planctomycetota bacterium]|nr:MAG: right-handed parallel beta-helix repeat-containing protein [Planctomycetota bacterium]